MPPADTPSIKGSAFQGALEDLQRLVAEGRIDRERLEAALEPEDLRLLDEKVRTAAWYPIAGYARMVELLAAVEGGSRPEAYLLDRGRRAAERLAASGLYKQLHATRETWGDRVGSIIVSMSAAIYNFTRWSIDFDPRTRGFDIEIRDAEAFPEVARVTAQGFVQAVTDRTSGSDMRVTSERPTPDRVVIRGRFERR